MEMIALAVLVGAASAFKLVSPIPKHGADFTISRMPSGRRLTQPAELKVTDHVVNLREEIFLNRIRYSLTTAVDDKERENFLSKAVKSMEK